jgi:hypothetical protein
MTIASRDSNQAQIYNQNQLTVWVLNLGAKTGGRKKGSLNKKTILRAQAALKQGLIPLEFLISVLADETKDIAVRLDAAKSAAPYVHPRLQTTTVQGGPIQVTIAREDLAL